MTPRIAIWCSSSLLLSITFALAPRAARADPQATVGLTIGDAGVGYDRHFWTKNKFHLGLRSDVMFGRSKATDFGVGPYVEVLTHAFNEIQFGGGVSGLLPVLPAFPIVLSFGGYGRKARDMFPLEPGITGQLFFGSRSYNFHANYVMAVGLLGQMRYGLGRSKETSIVISAQIDLLVLALPVIFLINAARGGSHDTDPVR
jgi:hypothetical protein